MNISNNNSCVKQEEKRIDQMSVDSVADTLLYFFSSVPSFLMKYCNQRNSVGFNRISAGVNLSHMGDCLL